MVSADAPASTSGVSVAGVMFISARTERIAVTRSTTQPISASAAGSPKSSCWQARKMADARRDSVSKPGNAVAMASVASSTAATLRGHTASTSRPSRLAVTAHNSSVMNGMNGCSSFRISSRAQATMARVSDLAAPSSPNNTGLASSRYQSQ